MVYRLVTNEERNSFAPELINSVHIIVTDEEKVWVVKQKNHPPEALKRDMLGFILGSKVANVAEVKALSEEEFNQIKAITNKDASATSSNTFLVRLGGSYVLDELRHKTLEAAVAAELVYSTWTRRRDAHVDNRCYIEGVPIFFDHETSFLWEADKAHATVFFRISPDYGHPSFWRVKEAPEKMTTQQIRLLDRSVKGAYHFVNNLDTFNKSIVIAENLIQTIFRDDFRNDIYRAGFSNQQVEIIYSFLRYNLNTLHLDLDLMKGVIFKE